MNFSSDDLQKEIQILRHIADREMQRAEWHMNRVNALELTIKYFNEKLEVAVDEQQEGKSDAEV